MFDNKTLLITGGTGSFGNTVLRCFMHTGVHEIRVFSRDEKKQEDMRIELDSDKVNLYCRWPFDLLTDEWISISNTFFLRDYIAAVEKLNEGQVSIVRGFESGELGFRLVSSGRVALQMIDSAKSRPAEFHTEVDADKEDLYPKRGTSQP